jgi:hypothetical protein
VKGDLSPDPGKLARAGDAVEPAARAEPPSRAADEGVLIGRQVASGTFGVTAGRGVSRMLLRERSGSKVQGRHRDRLAVVYVRQSSRELVLDHRKSTRLLFMCQPKNHEYVGGDLGSAQVTQR